MFNFQGISQEEGHKMLCCAFQHQDAFDETFISHLLVFLYGNYPKLAPVFSLSKFFVVKSKFRAPDVDTIFKFQPHSNSNIKLEFMFFCGAGENVTEARDNLLRQIHYDVKKNEFQYSNKHLQEQIKNMSIIRTNYYYNDTNNNNNNNNNVLQNNGNNNNNNNFAQYGNNNNNNNNFAQYGNNNNNNNNFAQYGNNNNNNNFAQGNNNNYNNCGNNNNNNNLQYGNNNNNNMIQYGNNHNNNNNNNNNMIESNNNNNNTIQFNNNNSVNCLDNYGNNNIVKHENDNNDILRENQNTISYFISERLENKDDVILVIKSVKAKLIQCYENGIVPDVESIAHEFDDATQKYKRFDPLWKVFVYHITQVLNAIKINDYQIGRAAVHAFIDDLHNCTQQTNH